MVAVLFDLIYLQKHAITPGLPTIMTKKWFALAAVGVLVDDSIWQLCIFAALHGLDLGVIVRFCPFANRYAELQYAKREILHFSHGRQGVSRISTPLGVLSCAFLRICIAVCK